MKRILYVALIAIVGICLVSCEKKQTEFYLSDLQGLWQNDNTTTWYMRFTTDTVDYEGYTGYFWGREWGDFGDDTTEADLFDPETYHGNGWFMYKLNLDGTFWFIHMMENKAADIAIGIVVSNLNLPLYIPQSIALASVDILKYLCIIFWNIGLSKRLLIL